MAGERKSYCGKYFAQPETAFCWRDAGHEGACSAEMDDCREADRALLKRSLEALDHVTQLTAQGLWLAPRDCKFCHDALEVLNTPEVREILGGKA